MGGLRAPFFLFFARLVATIPVGRRPIGVVVDFAETYAYATNSRSNNVSMISVASNRVVATITVGEPVRKSASPEIGFFLTVYPAKGAKAEARLELVHNGRALAALPLPLDQPDSAGRIQQVSRLPTASLTPATYELRVIITQGSQQIVRSTVIRLVE